VVSVIWLGPFRNPIMRKPRRWLVIGVVVAAVSAVILCWRPGLSGPAGSDELTRVYLITRDGMVTWPDPDDPEDPIVLVNDAQIRHYFRRRAKEDARDAGVGCRRAGPDGDPL
jgi:hypothetical protein